MNTKCKATLLAVAIATVVGSMLAASALSTTTAYAQSENNRGLPKGMAANFPGGMIGQGMAASRCVPSTRGDFSAPPRGLSGNVTIYSAQAKAVVEADTPIFTVGTVTGFGNGWVVPIEDGKGVVISIQVTSVSASTADQAKGIVEASLKGWKTGDPQLTGSIYSIPLLDSNGATIGYVRVDGRNGEIIRMPSTILTVTSEQAKTIVTNAAKEFTVGEAKDAGSKWVVGLNYNGKEVMTVLLGKINTPTSEAAAKAVQDSLGKGWSAEEPTLLRFTYNVPIIDANGNTIGSITVNGTTGTIATGIPMPRKMPSATPQVASGPEASS